MNRALGVAVVALLAWIGLEVHLMRTQQSFESMARDAARGLKPRGPREDTTVVAPRAPSADWGNPRAASAP